MLDRITLVVEDHMPGITLSEEQMRDALGLRRSVRLPAARVELINALNTGRPLVLDQPRAAYSRALRTLGGGRCRPGRGAGGQAGRAQRRPVPPPAAVIRERTMAGLINGVGGRTTGEADLAAAELRTTDGYQRTKFAIFNLVLEQLEALRHHGGDGQPASMIRDGDRAGHHPLRRARKGWR